MRSYEQSHPWLTFRLDLSKAPPSLWVLLGEARSKCEHIAGVPLQPAIAKELHSLFLAKGALATTAIEGNTLSEDQVRQIIDGTLKLPPSKQYLEREVSNIIGACNGIWQEVRSGAGAYPITVPRAREFNRLVLADLQLDEGVVPGEIRSHSVTVGRYLGAPAADCDYLLDRLCAWLSGPDFADPGGFGLVMPILKAVIAHLYLAWIHPFGDGNGRTARLMEFAILVSAGVPTAAAHLLSNHYNETRQRYYLELDGASKRRPGGDPVPFIQYAVEGFVDQLRAQLTMVRAQQLTIAWRDYLHDLIGPAPADQRRRELVLAVSARSNGALLDEIPGLSPNLAKAYGRKSQRTLRRDVEWALDRNLLQRADDGRLSANFGLILAFLPGRAPHAGHDTPSAAE